MPRGMKVYGWTGVRGGFKNSQARFVVAATSITEALRIAKIPRSTYTWSGSETRNADEVSVAMSDPGTVFYRPLDSRTGDRWERQEQRQ